MALVLFIQLHPLNTHPLLSSQIATLLALVAFPFTLLFASTWFVRELRVLSWLLLIPTVMVLVVMSWGCIGDAMIADAAIRAEASGIRYMNCGGTALLFTVPLTYLISLATFAISAVSSGVYYRLVRSANRNLHPCILPLSKSPL